MDVMIRKIVEDYIKDRGSVVSVAALYGDASYRRYFRVSINDGSSVIVMKMPDGISSASEEITNFKGDSNEPPYVNVSTFLALNNIHVPKILFFDQNHKAILLEDLGDELFIDRIKNMNDGQLFKEYKKAIDLMIKIQALPQSADCIAFKRSFDADLLNWEFDHFREYGIETRLNIELSKDAKKRFEQVSHHITAEIMKMDYTFTHRDFQSRNLMLFKKEMYLIDFQDSLQGPYIYDLVALLRDSYVKLSKELTSKLVEYFAEVKHLDKTKVFHDFNLVTIQRKLKDAGRFVYIDRVKKNSNYLKFIPDSIEYVKEALMHEPLFSELLEILKPYVEELANV